MTDNLLFDHNLPTRLVTRLADIFQSSNHVYLVNLNQATDQEVWEFARENNYTIVTKDSDFNDLSILMGAPPKVVWLRIGNASAQECESVLRKHHRAIVDFLDSPYERLLVLGRD